MRLTHENNAAPLAGGARVDEVIVQVKPSVQNNKPPAHHNAPRGTSHIAAHRVASKAPSLRRQVLEFLIARGTRGATDQEIQEALGLPSNTEIPRRWELVKAGKIVDSGFRRSTRSGCAAAVWVDASHANAATKPEEVPNG